MKAWNTINRRTSFVCLAALLIALGVGGNALGQEPPSPAGVTAFGVLNQGPADVEVVGGYAYTADRYGLTIYDVTDLAHPVKTGELLLPDEGFGIAVTGTTAYVADSTAGLQIVDVADPQNPRLLGACDIPGQVWDVAVSGSTAYLAAYGLGLEIVDVSNPSNPTVLGNFNTPGSAFGVAVSGTVAYVGDGNSGLQVIDVSDPANPVLLSSHTTTDTARGVAVVGSTVYLATSFTGLATFDVSNPADPVLKGSLETEQQAWRVTVSGTTAYLADFSAGLVIMNVADPSHPALLGSWRTPRFAYAVAVSGALAYVADRYHGLEVVDVSNPADPALRGEIETAGEANGAVVDDGLVYVADAEEGLQIVDISDPERPTIVGGVPLNGFSMAVALSGKIAYVAATWAGLKIIDAGDPSNPVLLGTLRMPNSAEDVAVDDGLAYVAASASGLRIVDISNPADPRFVGSYATQKLARSVALSGNIAWVGTTDSLLAIDVSDPARPVLLGEHEATIMARGLALSRNLLLAASGFSGMEIFDVSDPTKPNLMGRLDQDGFVSGVAVTGDIAWLAVKDAGWRAVDISDPAHPSPVAWDGGTLRPATALAMDPASGTGWFLEGPVMEGIHLGNSTCPTMTVTANPAFITVGGTTTTVAVRATDGSGHPVPGLHLAGRPDSGALSAFTDAGNGNYTATFTSGARVGWTGLALSITGTQCSATGQVHVTFPSKPALNQRAAHLTMIPGSGHSNGSYGTVWRSDAVLLNPGQREASVALFFLEKGRDNSGAVGETVRVPAGAALPLNDFVLSVFGRQNTSGAVLLSSDEPLFVTSRTYNDASTGTYGQLVPGVSFLRAVTGTETVRLIQLTHSHDYHTNIGFANASDEPLHVTVRLQRADGSSIGAPEYTVPPWGFYQKTKILGTTVDDAYAIISADSQTARYFTYASVVDNRSGDPIFVLPAEAATHELTIPAAAHAHGAADTDWRTDLEIHNPGGTAFYYTVDLLLRDQANPSPASKTFRIDPGQSIRMTDVLHSVFGFSGAAALRISLGHLPLMVTSRTYNAVSSGSYGQFIPGEGQAAATGAVRGGWLPGLSQSASDDTGLRTNIGLTNATGSTLAVRVALYDRQGHHLGDVDRTLEPYEFVQIGKIFRKVTAVPVSDGYAIVNSSTPGAAFYAYASVVDNRSGDPVNVPAVW